MCSRVDLQFTFLTDAIYYTGEAKSREIEESLERCPVIGDSGNFSVGHSIAGV
jgi:hypothetical protein